MSGLASILMSYGAVVSGSDLSSNPEVEALRRAGADIHEGHDAACVARDLDAMIVSSAIPDDNPEIAAAKIHAIPVVRRLHAVAALLQRFKSIGVVGTHGKTTTTAMTAAVLRSLHWDPSFLVGAHCAGLGGNAYIGRGAWFAAEVDESDGLFTTIRPTIAVLTNVGKDHLQTYRDLDAIRDAFEQYVRGADQAVLAIDDPHVRALAASFPHALTVGLSSDADLRAQGVQYDRFDSWFDLSLRGESLGRFHIPAPGEHNVRNALCALGAAILAGAEPFQAASCLSSICLPHRRFELLEENGVTVVDDYAHLPEEVDATLRAIRSGWPGRRIVAVFQPHRYSRTISLGRDFGRAFSSADVVVVTSIYAACEPPVPGLTSDAITDAIASETGAAAISIPEKSQVVSFLKTIIRPGDFIISFGAGDIWTVTEALAHFLEEGSFCVA